MAKKVHKGINKLLAFFLSVLGIGGACSMNSCMYGSPAMEYGTPFATFIIDGNVTDENSEDILGIKVVMEYDTTLTDSQGKFQTKTNAWPDNQDFTLQLKDIDGELNGSYEDLDTVIQFTDPIFEGGEGGWYDGEVKKEVDIILKKKDE